MEKKKIRDAEKAAIVHKISEISGLTIRQVYRVINGEQQNEDVIRAYMEFAEGENLLLQKVKELVPFDKPLKQTA